MIYNSNAIVYMQFLPSWTGFLNQLYEHRDGKFSNYSEYYFTKNSTIADLNQQSILSIDNSHLAQKAASLNEFALKGY